MKKNIIFYCHNFWWLWHTNRLLLIINNLINNFWGDYNLIFLNSWKKQDIIFKKINKLKIINLPEYEIENYKLIKNEKNIKVSKYREYIFNKIFSLKNIETLIIEHYPFWRNFLDDEIKKIIFLYKNNSKNWNIFSSVRDIFDINSLNRENLKLFDRFLVHTDKNLINYNDDFSFEIKNKIIYTWYVVNKNIKIKEINDENYILISLWWWQDWYENILEFLKIIKNNFLWNIYINLWILYDNQKVDELKKIVPDKVIVKKYFENFLELKKNAKIVVSMWWYNNLTENLFYKIKTIVFPRIIDNEQIKRLEEFSKISNFIIDWRWITIDKILSLIDKKETKIFTNINFDWSYYSSNFIVNYKKFKYIKIRLTNNCNAKCDMCGVIKREIHSNNIESLKNSILDFYKLWWKIVNLTWWEPTIYKWFWDLLKFIKNLWLITSVSTNWSTLWENFIKNLNFNNNNLINYIDISIDWLKNKQDKIRNFKGLFKIIDENLTKLIENNIFVHINITLRKDNIFEMQEIFNYLKNKKINSISFWMITSSPVNDTSNLIPTQEQIEKFYKLEKKYIIKNAWNINISFSPDYKNWDFSKFSTSIINKNNFTKSNREKCKYILSKKEIRINESWEISPCCEIDDFDEWLGNINKNWLFEIVCSNNYEKFLNKTFPNVSKACFNCKLEI